MSATAPRSPGPRRVSSEFWLTSDGQSWTDWHEANDHERFITLRSEVDLLMRMSLTSPDVFAKALLSSERLMILIKRSPRKG